MTKKLNKKKVAFASIISLGCLFLIINVIFSFLFVEDTPEPKKTKKKKEYPTVSLVAVGDNIIHERVFQYAKVGDTYDFTPCYRQIKKDIQKADLAFINQETILGGNSLKIAGYPAFNSPSELAKNLVDTGFNMINGASNHSFDRNIEGVNNASRTWRNFDNIIYAGTYDSASDRNKIRVIEKEGIKFALLSYTHTINEYNENPYTLLQRTPYAVPLLTDRQAIESDIKKAKELADVVIVSAHWGKENDATITNVQREYAQYFADLGVDLVIGTHPHLIQPVEWVAGVDGNKTLVAYSLGNFLSTMETKETQLEGMLSLDFVKKNKKIKIENVAFTPLVNHFGDNTIEVYRLSKYPKKKLANHFVLKDHPNAIKEFQAKTKEIIGNEIKIKE